MSGIRHSRASGNPAARSPDSRFRGSDALEWNRLPRTGKNDNVSMPRRRVSHATEQDREHWVGTGGFVPRARLLNARYRRGHARWDRALPVPARSLGIGSARL